MADLGETLLEWFEQHPGTAAARERKNANGQRLDTRRVRCLNVLSAYLQQPFVVIPATHPYYNLRGAAKRVNRDYT